MEYHNVEKVNTMDFKGFIDEVYILTEIFLGTGWGLFTQKKPTFSETKDIQMPQIVYSLNKREPGLVGKETRELKPRIRETKTNIDNQGYKTVTEVYGRVIDCTVEFIIYGSNNKETDELTNDFREMMDRYQVVLAKKGMHKMWYLEDIQRSDRENLNDPVSSRSISYKVTLEEQYSVEKDTISKIIVLADNLRDSLIKEGKLPSQNN